MCGVAISFITDNRKIDSYQTEIPEETKGIVLNSFSNFAKKAYNHVFEEPLVDFDGFSAILATGYQTVELKEELNSFNGCHSDDDNITDWDEVDVDYWASCGLITFDDNNNVVLPTVEQCMNYSEASYVVEALDRLQSELGKDFGDAIALQHIMPISSDPTQEDSDGDGIIDKYDPNKLKTGDINTMCLYDYEYNKKVMEHYYVRGNLIHDNLFRICYCINCNDKKRVPEYYEDHYYINYPVTDDVSNNNNDFEYVPSDVLNPLGSIEYNGEKYTIAYLDVTDGRQWITENYHIVNSIKLYNLKFDWVDAFTNHINTTEIPLADFIQYDGLGNVIQGKGDIFQTSEYNQANRVLVYTVALDFIQSGLSTYNLVIDLLESQSGVHLAQIAFYISYPPKAGKDISFSPTWKMAINSRGHICFLSDWSRIVDFEGGKIYESN